MTLKLRRLSIRQTVLLGVNRICRRQDDGGDELKRDDDRDGHQPTENSWRSLHAGDREQVGKLNWKKI